MNTCAKRMLVAVGLFLLVASWAIAEEPFDGQTQTWRGLFFTMKVESRSAARSWGPGRFLVLPSTITAR